MKLRQYLNFFDFLVLQGPLLPVWRFVQRVRRPSQSRNTVEIYSQERVVKLNDVLTW